jgi:O-antigen/teichoic acid export membrane protein
VAATTDPKGGDLLDSPEAGGAAIRGSALRALGYGVITLLGLATAPILVRQLGVVGFGRYTTVVSLIAIVATVTDAGLAALAVRELSLRTATARAALMRELVGVRIALTSVGVGAAIGFAALAGYPAELVVGTGVAGIGLLAYALQSAFGLPLAADLRLGWVTAGEVLRQAVFTLAVIVLVLAGAGLVPLLAAPIAGGLAALVPTMWLVRHQTPFMPSFDVHAWKKILRQTLPIAAAGAIYNVYFRMIVLVMSLMAAGTELGYFSLSFRIVEVLVIAPLIVFGSVLPLLARAARDDLARLANAFQQTFAVAVIAGVGITLLTYAGARLAMVILGEPSSPAVRVLEIHQLPVAAAFLTQVYSFTFIAQHRHRELIALNAVTLAATLVLALVLVPAYGAVGGAWAAVTGEWLLLAGYAMAGARGTPALRPAFGPNVRRLAAAGAGLLAIGFVDLEWAAGAAEIVLAGSIYTAALVALRAVPPELLAALPGGRSRTPG